MSYLERYLAGEHESVWDDLCALGPATLREPVYAEAVAVTRELMCRVRHNIELLINRLGTLGYQFGYDWWDADYRDILECEPPPPPFREPQPDVQRQLGDLETRVGALPLSLRAWFEHVGAVNLVGMFPVAAPSDPGGFTSYVQFVRSGGRAKGRRFPEWPCGHDLDPLYIDSLDRILEGTTRRMTAGGTCELQLAPDEWLKYGISGSGPYAIRMPNPAADANVENEWHDTTFVNYLRVCFRWGGFPGLECKSVRPEREIAFLTSGLLPI